MSETRGMSRRELFQYEARQRRLRGESKLHISIKASEALKEEKAIDKLLCGIANSGENNIESSALAAYSPEFMYGSDEENAADWANAGIDSDSKSDW
jgi:hypothetical protein